MRLCQSYRPITNTDVPFLRDPFIITMCREWIGDCIEPFVEVFPTMKKVIALGLFTVTMVAISGLIAGESLKSGPQVGKQLPGPFHPLNATGGQEGKKHCLV
jgi:hypothetical protein